MKDRNLPSLFHFFCCKKQYLGETRGVCFILQQKMARDLLASLLFTCSPLRGLHEKKTWSFCCVFRTAFLYYKGVIFKGDQGLGGPHARPIKEAHLSNLNSPSVKETNAQASSRFIPLASHVPCSVQKPHARLSFQLSSGVSNDSPCLSSKLRPGSFVLILLFCWCSIWPFRVGFSFCRRIDWLKVREWNEDSVQNEGNMIHHEEFRAVGVDICT